MAKGFFVDITRNLSIVNILKLRVIPNEYQDVIRG